MRRALFVLLLFVVGGCTVATDSEPRAIDRDAVPGNLLETTTTTSTTTPEGTTVPVCFYLLSEGDGTTLVGVTRPLPVDTLAADKTSVLTELLSLAPNPDDPAEDGLSSAIPEGSTLKDTAPGVDNQTLTVDLGPELTTQSGGTQLRNAFAQIVYTATEDPAIQQVRFLVDGVPTQPFIRDGVQTDIDRAVSRADYSENLASTPCA